jgi:predicted RNA-binding protein
MLVGVNIVNYWLFVTTPDNWQISKEKNVVGYAERYQHALSQVSKGDKCLLYITSISAIDGKYEVVSQVVYYDHKQIFHSPPTEPRENFPLRLDLRRLGPPTAPISFRPLIPKLSFIKNKKNWGGTFQGAVLRISEEDYRIIVSSLMPSL